MNNLVFFHIDKINSGNSEATIKLRENLESNDWFKVYWGNLEEETIKDYIVKLNNAEKVFYIYVHYYEYGDYKIPFEITICESRIEGESIQAKRICTLCSKEYVNYIMEETKIIIDKDFNNYNDYVKVIENEEVFNRIEYFSNFEKCTTDGCLDRQFKINRDEDFLYDVNAISFSKSFRRLQDKAQIFSSSKGDHFRTRLTHTNDVVRVGKIITRKINRSLIENGANFSIDENEVEAIALGHDIGHTPFGHQGERTLNDIIGRSIVIPNGGKELLKDMGGFKHNIQSVRVLTHIEENSLKYDGLNISYRVLEGILKHSKYSKNDVRKIIENEIVDHLNVDADEEIDNNYNKQEEISDFDNMKYSNTYLSGKIVNLADEIAQRGSDIEDAVKAKKVKLEELISILKCTKYKEVMEKVLNIYKERSNTKKFDKEGIRLYIFKEIIVDILIDDIVRKENVRSIGKDKDKSKLWFSNDVDRLNNMIDNIIRNKVVMSQEVTKFDNDAHNIIFKLFKAYYKNPRLLNDNVIHRIFFDMYDNELLKHYAVDFRNMEKEYVERVIENIHSIDADIYKKLGNITSEDENLIKYKLPDELEKEIGVDTDKYKLLNLKICYEQQKIIIRNICDYIAGMTDSFALEEYNGIK